MPLFTQQVVGIAHLALSKSLERKSQQRDTGGTKSGSKCRRLGPWQQGQLEGGWHLRETPTQAPPGAPNKPLWSLPSPGLAVGSSCQLLTARLLCPWDSSGKTTGVGCHFLLQGIFLTQESNPGPLHCRQILYQLSCEGIPDWD